MVNWKFIECGNIAELFQKLGEMHVLLTDQEVTSVRLVVNPEKMVIREAERSFMYLNLYGFCTDAVIVYRLLPEVELERYFEKWGELQHSYLRYIKDQFSPIPVFTVPLFRQEVVGFADLEKRRVFRRKSSRTVFLPRTVTENQSNGRGVYFGHGPAVCTKRRYHALPARRRTDRQGRRLQAQYLILLGTRTGGA